MHLSICLPLLCLSLYLSTAYPKAIMYIQGYVGWYVSVCGCVQQSRCPSRQSLVWCTVVSAATVCLFTSHSHLEFISNAFASGGSSTHSHKCTHTDSSSLCHCLVFSHAHHQSYKLNWQVVHRKHNFVFNKVSCHCEMSEFYVCWEVVNLLQCCLFPRNCFYIGYLCISVCMLIFIPCPCTRKWMDWC